MQRSALYKSSLNQMKKPDVQNINFILNNINQQSIIEEHKKAEEIRQFINNRIFAINEKRHNMYNFYNVSFDFWNYCF